MYSSDAWLEEEAETLLLLAEVTAGMEMEVFGRPWCCLLSSLFSPLL